MEQIGFYDAPASGSFHLAKAGGLAEHSMNVMDCARSIAVSLLGKEVVGGEQGFSHDLCAAA